MSNFGEKIALQSLQIFLLRELKVLEMMMISIPIIRGREREREAEREVVVFG